MLPLDSEAARPRADTSRHRTSQQALRLTAQLNSAYYTPEQVRQLLGKLTGSRIDEMLPLFPPFYTDFGKNIALGRRIFINAGCRFQDQGGISIGDDCLIGNNVWLGANVSVLPRVSIGQNAVIAAGAVLTADVPENTVAVGVPARVVRHPHEDA